MENSGLFLPFIYNELPKLAMYLIAALAMMYAGFNMVRFDAPPPPPPREKRRKDRGIDSDNIAAPAPKPPPPTPKTDPKPPPNQPSQT